MSDIYETRSGEHTPSDDGDVGSLTVSVTTSPRSLIKVGLEFSFRRVPESCDRDYRLSDDSKLRSFQQKLIVTPSAANSKTLKGAHPIQLSRNPSVPGLLILMTKPKVAMTVPCPRLEEFRGRESEVSFRYPRSLNPLDYI